MYCALRNPAVHSGGAFWLCSRYDVIPSNNLNLTGSTYPNCKETLRCGAVRSRNAGFYLCGDIFRVLIGQLAFHVSTPYIYLGCYFINDIPLSFLDITCCALDCILQPLSGLTRIPVSIY